MPQKMLILCVAASTAGFIDAIVGRGWVNSSAAHINLLLKRFNGSHAASKDSKAAMEFISHPERQYIYPDIFFDGNSGNDYPL